MIEIEKPIFGLIMVLLSTLAAIMAWRATHNKDSDFNFTEAFLDDRGKTSHARIAYFVALTCSTWAFVFMTLNDKITEWYFTGYMVAWVFGSLGNKWLDKKE